MSSATTQGPVAVDDSYTVLFLGGANTDSLRLRSLGSYSVIHCPLRFEVPVGESHLVSPFGTTYLENLLPKLQNTSKKIHALMLDIAEPGTSLPNVDSLREFMVQKDIDCLILEPGLQKAGVHPTDVEESSIEFDQLRIKILPLLRIAILTASTAQLVLGRPELMKTDNAIETAACQLFHEQKEEKLETVFLLSSNLERGYVYQGDDAPSFWIDDMKPPPAKVVAEKKFSADLQQLVGARQAIEGAILRASSNERVTSLEVTLSPEKYFHLHYWGKVGEAERIRFYDEWEQGIEGPLTDILSHQFVRQAKNGTLSKAEFLFFVMQDLAFSGVSKEVFLGLASKMHVHPEDSDFATQAGLFILHHAKNTLKDDDKMLNAYKQKLLKLLELEEGQNNFKLSTAAKSYRDFLRLHSRDCRPHITVASQIPCIKIYYDIGRCQGFYEPWGDFNHSREVKALRDGLMAILHYYITSGQLSQRDIEEVREVYADGAGLELAFFDSIKPIPLKKSEPDVSPHLGLSDPGLEKQGPSSQPSISTIPSSSEDLDSPPKSRRVLFQKE